MGITNGVKMWYMELCQLGIVGGVCGFRTSPDLHMTQVLWKASKKVGCGLQLTKSYGMIKYVMFANYEPKGNFYFPPKSTYEGNLPRCSQLKQQKQNQC